MAQTRSRVLIGGMIVVALIHAPIAVAEKADKDDRTKRVVEASYSTPAIGVETDHVVTRICAVKADGSGDGEGCVEFLVKPSERFIDVEIRDATGLPAPAYIDQDHTDTWVPICGKTAKPVPIHPGIPVLVWLYPLRSDPPCQGASTRGTVRATLSAP